MNEDQQGPFTQAHIMDTNSAIVGIVMFNKVVEFVGIDLRVGLHCQQHR